MARNRASRHTIGVPRELWQAVFFIRTTYPDRICYHPSVMIASVVCFSLRESRQGSAPPFHPNVSHPEFCSAVIPPECLTSGILLCRHSIRIFHIRHLTPDGRGGRFNFPSQTYLNPLTALTRRVSQPFCTVPWCSLEASRYVRLTFLDIFLQIFGVGD